MISGQFGLHAMLALYLQKHLKQNIYIESTLIFTALMTFSMGTFLGLLIYIIFQPNKLFILITTILIMVLGLYLFPIVGKISQFSF